MAELDDLIGVLNQLRKHANAGLEWDRLIQAVQEEGWLEDAIKLFRDLQSAFEQRAVESDKTSTTMASDIEQRFESALPEFGDLRVEVEADAERVDRNLSQMSFLDRYVVGKEIARGGVGVINQAFEKNLRRHLVVKRLIDQEKVSKYVLEKFIEEAQITAQLEHPNIVPVHDMGKTNSGEIYFSMKYVGGESLKGLIKRLRSGDEAVTEAFPRAKMLNLFQSVCMAIAFAHDRGIIHRDIKPANIMVGQFGETLVLDWGVAKVLKRDASSGSDASISTSRAQSQDQTQMGLVTGTPAYMAPEQAAGRIDRLDARTDIFSLGVLLYEMLVYRSPFRKASQRDTLRAVIVDKMPSFESWPDAPNVPERLENICIKCLEKRPSERYQKVEDILQDLLTYQEGVEDVDRRRRMSQSHLKDGLTAVRKFETINQELQSAQAMLSDATWETPTFAALENRRKIWSLSAKLSALKVQAEKAFAEGVGRLSEAVSFDEHNRDAADELARLYWSRLKDAERFNDVAAAIYYRDAVARYDRGLFTERLKGEGGLIVKSSPMDATVSIAAVMEVDLRLTQLTETSVGRTPILNHALREGTWIVSVSKPGFNDLKYPIRIRRGEVTEIHCRLITSEQVGDHYLHVPGGPCVVGGDPECPSSQISHQVEVDDFLISRYPVTCVEYLAFLNAIDKTSPQATQFRVPRLYSKGGFLWQRNTERVFTLPNKDTRGFRWSPHFPVVGISFEDAQAFCEWYSQATGNTYRLPTEYEWEKAARGTDERRYPWGDVFDAFFCKTADSKAGVPSLENVGSYPSDCSPYDVYDMAGLVSEYCNTDFSGNDSRKVVRGGNYESQGSSESRATFRAGAEPTAPSLRYGFRMVRPVD